MVAALGKKEMPSSSPLEVDPLLSLKGCKKDSLGQDRYVTLHVHFYVIFIVRIVMLPVYYIYDPI